MKSIQVKTAGGPEVREELLDRAGAVLSFVASGKLRLRVGGTYPLAAAASAHRELEGRKSVGKLLLMVQ